MNFLPERTALSVHVYVDEFTTQAKLERDALRLI